jgi:dihydroneopterin aldolase
VDRILIMGIRALGTHGLLPEEQARPQPFEVDVELLVDLATAGQTDVLTDTVDYAAVADTVIRIVEKGHHRLLEVLAARIAEACRADHRVQGVVVTVRKLRPPVGALLDHVAVRIER